MSSVIYINPVADIETLKVSKLEHIMDVLAESVDLNAIGMEELDLAIQRVDEVGNRFSNFLRTLGTLIVRAGRRTRIVRIDRTKVFDPVRFMDHPGLRIEEQDQRSIMIEEIDPSDISLESMLQDETVIGGEEHLKRLKQKGYVRLDAGIFQTLWENQHLIPEDWKGTLHEPKYVFFDGTVLRNQYGRYVISMYWDKDKKWNWTYCRLDAGGWKAEDLSAVLKVQ
jgi:hypothetical protein